MSNLKNYKGKIIFLLLLILIFFIMKFDLYYYVNHRDELKIVIENLGYTGILVYIVVYVLVTISCISPLPVAVVGGLVYGVVGIIYTMIGASIGLVLSFLISRYLIRDRLEKRFKNNAIYQKINKGLEEDGWFILAVTRLLPIFPFGIQNYIYGLTSVRFLQYSILSIIFIFPGTCVFTLLAGAVASGNIKTAGKLSLIASIIFLILTIITKIISKKIAKKDEKKSN